VIEGETYAPADLHGLSTDSMLEGTKVTTYQGTDGSLYVNDMKIIGDPIEAGNGIVYIYDGAIHVEE